MLAAGQSWLCAPFSAPAGAGKEPGQVKPAGPESRNFRKSHRSLRYGIRAGLACELRFGARLMELPRVSLLSVPSGLNSLQIRCVLIVFSFSPCP